MIQSVEMGTESGASDNSLNTETQRSIGNGFTARGEYKSRSITFSLKLNNNAFITLK